MTFVTPGREIPLAKKYHELMRIDWKIMLQARQDTILRHFIFDMKFSLPPVEDISDKYNKM